MINEIRGDLNDRPPSIKDNRCTSELSGSPRKYSRRLHIRGKEMEAIPIASNPSVCPLRCFVFPSFLGFDG